MARPGRAARVVPSDQYQHYVFLDDIHVIGPIQKTSILKIHTEFVHEGNACAPQLAVFPKCPFQVPLNCRL